jgi:transposase
MDSACDAAAIKEHGEEFGHVVIVDPKAPGDRKSELPLRQKLTRQLSPAQRIRFRERTMVERVYSRLKDEFGASYVRVRGPQKVMAHLMFCVLALTADQLLKLAG